MRIVVVSDTHIASGADNSAVRAAFEAASAIPADLIVNAGDISADGADKEADLRAARELHGVFAAPMAFIPGNHDLGDPPCTPLLTQPVNAERLARYRAVFGADWWARDLGAWRLIGFNNLLVGTNHPDEAAQWEWLKREIDAAKGRPLGVFLHKPLWLEHSDDAPSPMWTIDPEQRARYAAALSSARFLVSGHLHQYSARKYGNDVLHVWAPSCAFPNRHDLGGERRTGFVTLDLDDAGAVASTRILSEAP